MPRFFYSRCAGETYAAYMARVQIPALPDSVEKRPFLAGVGYFGAAGDLVGYVSMRK